MLIYTNDVYSESAELIADSNVVVLDVRTAAEFAEGHIQRAILIDQGQSDFVEKAKATLPTDETILKQILGVALIVISICFALFSQKVKLPTTKQVQVRA